APSAPPTRARRAPCRRRACGRRPWLPAWVAPTSLKSPGPGKLRTKKAAMRCDAACRAAAGVFGPRNEITSGAGRAGSRRVPLCGRRYLGRPHNSVRQSGNAGRLRERPTLRTVAQAGAKPPEFGPLALRGAPSRTSVPLRPGGQNTRKPGFGTASVARIGNIGQYNGSGPSFRPSCIPSELADRARASSGQVPSGQVPYHRPLQPPQRRPRPRQPPPRPPLTRRHVRPNRLDDRREPLLPPGQPHQPHGPHREPGRIGGGHGVAMLAARKQNVQHGVPRAVRGGELPARGGDRLSDHLAVHLAVAVPRAGLAPQRDELSFAGVEVRRAGDGPRPGDPVEGDQHAGSGIDGQCGLEEHREAGRVARHPEPRRVQVPRRPRGAEQPRDVVDNLGDVPQLRPFERKPHERGHVRAQHSGPVRGQFCGVAREVAPVASEAVEQQGAGERAGGAGGGEVQVQFQGIALGGPGHGCFGETGVRH
ncbi:hypothetical protein DFJ74DRAFT_745878, partial [Hyaloraphidium curvatum]